MRQFATISGHFLAICLLLALVSCASLSSPEKTIFRVKSEFELLDGIDFEINNDHGDLHVRQGSPGSIQIELFIQRTEGSQASAEIDRVIRDDRLVLHVAPETKREEGELLRVDAVVMVPSTPRLRLTSEHGSIEVKKLANPLIEAQSSSGELRLTASSIMRAETESGTIRATIMQPGWNGESRLRSAGGQIRVYLPLGPNLDLSARAGKSLSSEFKLDIRDNGDTYDAAFRSGNGSDAIVIESLRGQVELYSLVFDPGLYGPASITSPQTN